MLEIFLQNKGAGCFMIWTLFRYKWKRIMRQPVLFLFLILFPVALIGIFAFVFSHFFVTERENIKLGIVDLDQTFETNMLISQLQNEEQLKDIRIHPYSGWVFQ